MVRKRQRLLKLSQRSRLGNRFSQFEGLKLRASRSRESNRIGDTERGKINKFKGTTVFSGGKEGYSFIPAGGKCKTAGCYQSTKGGSAAVHAEDTRDFLRRDYTLLVGSGLCFPSLLSVDSLKHMRRTHFHYSAISLRWFFCVRMPRANCTKMQAMHYWDASTSRRRVVGIRCEQSEYYACEKYAGDKNRGCQAEFSKIPIQEGIFMIALLSTIKKWFAIATIIFTSFLFY